MVSGKHVFCEKSITVNSRQLEECVAIAQEKGLVICDGMTLLHMPLYKELKKKIAEGAIGDVKMVQVNLGSCKEYDVKNRFFSKELAGGALLDIGVYATSFARYFMKSKPDVVLTTANYFETGVDETSEILLKNPDGEMAVMALTMRAKQPKRGVVAGEKGFIEIYDYPRAAKATITYTESGKTEVIEAGESAKAPQYEVADMQDYPACRKTPCFTYTHSNLIINRAKLNKVSNIIADLCITIRTLSNVIAVAPYSTIFIDSIKYNSHALSLICFWK